MCPIDDLGGILFRIVLIRALSLSLVGFPSISLGMLDSLAKVSKPFAPSYSSTYDLDRKISTWNQSFSFNHTIGRLSLSNNTSVVLGNDERTDRTTRNNSLNTNVDYKVNPRLSVGLRMNFSRYLDEMRGRADQRPLKQGKEQVQMSSGYSFSPFKTGTVDLSFNAGSQSDMQQTREGNGKSGNFLGSFRFDPSQKVSLTSELKGDFSRLSSKEKVSGLETLDKNLSNGFSGRLMVKPHSFVTLDLSGGVTTSQFQYPQRSTRGPQAVTGQETRKGESDDLELKASFQGKKNFKGDLTAKVNKSLISYSLEQDRSSDITAKSVSGVMSHNLWNTLSLSVNFSDEIEESEFEGTAKAQNGSAETRTLGGSTGVKLGKRTDTKFIGNISLVRYMYDDQINNFEDRDSYSDRLRFEVTYQPSQKINGGAGVAKSAERSVYIRAKNVNNTRKGDSYTIDSNLLYKPSAKVSLSQRYSLTADYTRYPRISTKNYLTRTNQIITSFRYSPAPRVSFDVGHSFRYQDRGSYTPDETGVEKYGLSGGNNIQELSLTLNYTLRGGMSFSVSERFQSNRDFTYKNGKKSMLPGKKALQLSRKANIGYDFRDGSSLTASFQRGDSEGVGLGSIDKQYWKINVVYRRNFQLS